VTKFGCFTWTCPLIDAALEDRHISRRAVLFRWGVVAVAVVSLLLQLPALRAASPFAIPLLFATILAARVVPVAVAREKAITFCPAFVFAGSLLASGPAAGLAAMLAYGLHGRLFQKGGRRYAIFLGAQMALAAMASQTAFSALTGRANVLSGAGSIAFGAICAGGAAFVMANALLAGIGNLGTRYARRSYAEPALRAHALSYGVSFPYAALLLSAYGAYGPAALPALAALLLVCAHAVRMTVEHRTLKRSLEAVDSLSRSCAAELREEAPLEKFLELARGLAAFDYAVLWLEDEATGDLRPRAAFPRDAALPDLESPRLHTLLDRATRRTDPLLVLQVPTGARADGGAGRAGGAVPEGDESWILYPVILHGRCIGVAHFTRRARRPFTKADMERLGTLVPQAAISFEGARNRYLMNQYEEMMRHYQDMAQTDGLTGLYNHRRSQELLREEVARAARYHHPLAVMMVDVDFFKHYNDAYGHPQGDTLLVSIAHILRAGVRATDHVGRYGGEEFILILPETTGTDAYLLADRLRGVIEEARFPAGEGWVVQKTVSIGVAAFPLDARSAAEMLQKSDAALYRAKHTGKNRVVMAEHDTLEPAALPEVETQRS
jgi:diguanylate cyclase (GGDEF)-like protein